MEDRDASTNSQGMVMHVKIARFIATKPRACLLGTLSLCILLTVTVVVAGNFKLDFSNDGWSTRGTIISDREMQSNLILRFQEDLFWNEFISISTGSKDTDSSPWTYLQKNSVKEFIHMGRYSRRLANNRRSRRTQSCNSTWLDAQFADHDCIEEYLQDENNLVAIWKVNDDVDEKASILDPKILSEMCKAEDATTAVLGENGICKLSDSGTCQTPHSISRLVWRGLENILGIEINSCDEVFVIYSENVQAQDKFLGMLLDCSNAAHSGASDNLSASSCLLPGFLPHLVDKDFGIGGNSYLKYSSSIFFCSFEDAETLYNLYNSFGRGDETFVKAVYDTHFQDISELYTKNALFRDTAFAFASSLVTTSAMFIHSKSLWLTFMGLLQILFAAPLSYFVYRFFIGLSFFPILNFIALFVSAALGADDLFVAVDKWKNERISNPLESTENIAAKVLPDAAGAMLLTTSTTAVAFFATCITPVPPIFTFALFCGLMVIFNYVLNCTLVFPALCLYDEWLTANPNNCLVASKFGKKVTENEYDDEEIPRTNENRSRIHHILEAFYEGLHKFRSLILVLFGASMAVTIYFASTIELPDNSDVRMLPPSSSFEQFNDWSRFLLSNELNLAASPIRVYWGLKEADSGDHLDPYTMSSLRLDESFDPKSKEAQEYLKSFCQKLWDNDFVQNPNSDLDGKFKCPMNAFEDWLLEQDALPVEMKEILYTKNCDGASSVPMDENYFHSCFTTWSKLEVDEIYDNRFVLSQDGIVRIIWLEVSAAVRFTDPYIKIHKEWEKYESWFRDETLIAPVGVNAAFHTGPVWRWKDTTSQILRSALSATTIAIGFSTAVVMVSSKSLRLTLFSALSITFILAAATACLVGLGWNLGFIESICFAILIGISCDFVIHFGHAYLLLPGDRSKEERSKHAIIHMGPSILAAAATTFSSAIIMLFCKLLFMTKFAQMLSLTITFALIGSFVVYVNLTDSFGPREPTKLYDNILRRLTRKEN